MLKTVEKNDINPVCPHCEQELNTIYSQQMESTFGKRYIYFCPECKKVLGVSHRKGFWMG